MFFRARSSGRLCTIERAGACFLACTNFSLPGDKTLLHTHPTTVTPHRDHFRIEFDSKLRACDHRVEADLDWSGRITFFDDQQINLPDPGNIIDTTGRKVIGSAVRK